MTFNLIEKRKELLEVTNELLADDFITAEDIFDEIFKQDKEFISLLKEEVGNKCDCIITDPHRKGVCWIFELIDKLAGTSLYEEKDALDKENSQ